jgi:hypothetical protein
LGLSSIELIINAESKYPGTPFFPKAAITGTVPCIHNGDNIPKKDAALICHNPNPFDESANIFPEIRRERYTDTSDPITSPDTQ